MSASTRILLAGDGTPFREDVLAAATALARERDATVSVLQLVRVWGSGLGLPHPGLKPNAAERQAADSSVRKAVAYLDRQQVAVSGKHVIPTRNPAKAVLREADRIGAHIVVMGAPTRRRIGDLTWSNEPHRVARQAARRARPEVRLVLPA